jgi:2-phosphosulfolactate phosphatase
VVVEQERTPDRSPAASGDPSFDQAGFAYRFDWGPEGLLALAPHCAVIVVVDVLRFTSAVSAAIEAGAVVLPFRWADDGAADYAACHRAVLAGRREEGGPSLSPTDLLTVVAGSRVVLPSPNGSALAFGARELGVRHVLAGCLRNATATAAVARELAGQPANDADAIGVLAAGERWHAAGGPLRAAVEDLIGAGAILAALDPSGSISTPGCSPEAAAARAAFVAARPRLREAIAQSASGRELVSRGWSDDVDTASAFDVSPRASLLRDAEFVGRFPTLQTSG